MWRNRDRFLRGREQIVDFLTEKWERELDHALRKSPWTFADNRIAVRFRYECRDAAGDWYRSYGNENWEFDEHGLMSRREASISDLRITEAERRIIGPRSEAAAGTEIPLQRGPPVLGSLRCRAGRAGDLLRYRRGRGRAVAPPCLEYVPPPTLTRSAASCRAGPGGPGPASGSWRPVPRPGPPRG